jgi:hypothetical protein
MIVVLAVLFIALEALAALWLGAVSVHGPSGLGFAAIGYFVVAATVTWASAALPKGRSRARGAAIVAGTGVLMVALAPALLLTLDRIETHRYRKRVAATRVEGVRDEPIRSPNGDEIGVRVSFTVNAPSAGWYTVSPSLYSMDRASGLWLLPVRGRVDGTPFIGRLEAGRHALDFELYPGIVVTNAQGGGPCLSPVEPPALPAAGEPRSPLRLEIGDTSYGSPWRGGREETTRHAYSVVEMYRAVLAGGLARCDSATQ